jgi:hypothetical protein
MNYGHKLFEAANLIHEISELIPMVELSHKNLSQDVQISRCEGASYTIFWNENSIEIVDGQLREVRLINWSESVMNDIINRLERIIENKK